MTILKPSPGPSKILSSTYYKCTSYVLSKNKAAKSEKGMEQIFSKEISHKGLQLKENENSRTGNPSPHHFSFGPSLSK